MELRDLRNVARSRPALECAQCGERLSIPEWSEYLVAGRVRHLGRCQACDYAFETTVYYAAA